MMPSERPIMPAETHQSLLRYGQSKCLPIQAGEVIEYRTPTRVLVQRAGVNFLVFGSLLASLLMILGLLI